MKVVTQKALQGEPGPLGAMWDEEGVNFALFSKHATRVELCLFESSNSPQESERLTLPAKTHYVWHGYVPKLKPGQLYGYRVYGTYDPKLGQRFNPNKILLDPYAKAIGRGASSSDLSFGYRLGDTRSDESFDNRDNASVAPLASVINPHFDWGSEEPIRRPWNETIIYELHVKGFSKLHPEIPKLLRGTYAALASKEAIRYLKGFGVTAVELMPVHSHLDAKHLVDKGLTNYWGYDTLSYFAPEMQYASQRLPQAAVDEFKRMVKALHKAGIEVILDVVYNHTGEGDHLGPTLSFRGIDNLSYYRLSQKSPRNYEDFTGCGNTLNMRSLWVLQLLADSLRYWVLEMHVDGFRFDLAAALARELYDMDKLSAFFNMIRKDSVLSKVKLIAEPWDLGPGGYQVGNFPAGWTEWNGKYRDAMRRFWKGDEGVASEFTTRLCGSSDLYGHNRRRPEASINFVTSHDGFTLRDLVSYNAKHNQTNGEGNRDGENTNLSWNHGVEGPTENPQINELRIRQQKNFLATLLLSQGVPMIRSGDEMGHSQNGNNNAYCQDNETSWLSWKLNQEQSELLQFTRKLIWLRRNHPVLRRREFFSGRVRAELQTKDATFFDPHGNEMNEEAWRAPFVRCLGAMFSDLRSKKNETSTETDTFLVLMNAHYESIPFQLPLLGKECFWHSIFDTSKKKDEKKNAPVAGGFIYPLAGRVFAFFQLANENKMEIIKKGGF